MPEIAGTASETLASTPTPAGVATPTVARTPTPTPTVVPTPTPTVAPTPTATPTPAPFNPQDYRDRVWAQRVDAALAPFECLLAEPVIIPKGHYTGALNDSHFHMPVLADSPPGEEPGEDQIEGYAEWLEWLDEFDGPLDGDADGEGPNDTDDEEADGPDLTPEELAEYLASPIAGRNITVSELACTLRTEGTTSALSYFGVYDGNEGPMLDMAYRTVQEYGDVFVPFINPPNDDESVPGRPPTVEAAVVEKFLSVYPGLFQGFGELGLYELGGRTDADFPPDSKLLSDIYPIVRQNNLVVYLHPGDGQTANLARALSDNPDITFIVHGDQVQDSIESLMDTYPNIYYTIDALYGDQFLLGPQETVETFLAKTANFGPLLAVDWDAWKAPIERHPDRFMWGTDRGGPSVWTFDLRVSLRLVEYARAFIGGLAPAAQPGYAYANAQRIFDNSGL